MNKGYLTRLGVFVAVALVVTVLDLGTKEWAKANLARVDHPIPILVPAELDGKTTTDLLEWAGFGDAKSSKLRLLSPPLEVKGNEEFSPFRRLSQGEEAYYLFLDKERKYPPLMVMNPSREDLVQAKGEGDRDAWRAKWSTRVTTWAQACVDSHPFLDKEEVSQWIDEGYLHPMGFGTGGLSDSRTVKASETYLLTERNIEVIPGFFQFIYAENPGAAWGMLGDAPLWVRQLALQLLTLIAMILMVVVALRMPALPGHWGAVAALAMIMGGALGNFVERIARHFVVDFIDMYVGTNHWPTYNVADIGISVGVGILLLQMLIKKSPFQEKKES